MVILQTLLDAVERLKAGEVGILPTDTVYGLVCLAANHEAVQRLYELKDRVNKPGIVIAADVQQLIDLGVKARYLKPVEHFWPNPISVELPVEPSMSALHNGRGVVAFRIPKDPVFREFLAKTGPLLTTSANHPGEAPAVNVAQAKQYFGDTVDFYIDGGALQNRPPSTVIRIVDDVVEVIRAGAIKINEYGEIEA